MTTQGMVFVTGATGFLGRSLVARLLAAGYGVRVLVRPGSDTRFLSHTGVEQVLAHDITDAAALQQGCAGCQAVIHAAALFRMWGLRPVFWQTNVAGTAAVLAAAQAAGVGRVVHISTVVVVGRTIPGRVIDETHPCRPLDNYQRTKLEAERLALAYYRNRGLPVVVLRPGALYGPWGQYAFNRNFFVDPLQGLRIRVAGGRHVTFPAFAPDVAQAIVLALTCARPGHIYNVSGESLDHNSINNTISDLAGIGRWRIGVPVPAVLALARAMTLLARYTGREPFYPINFAHYVFQDWPVSSAKAETELGFRATPFAEGARQTLEWYWSTGQLARRRHSS